MPASAAPRPDRPTLFFLHFLGGSARSWAAVADALAPVADCVPIDLPGFGDAAHLSGYSVADMADHVAATIRAHGAGRWLLAGHSMGCKVAAALARRAEDGAEGLAGLSGLVLVSGSPPSPEPMAEEKRQAMLGWFAADAAHSRREAEGFIQDSVSQALAGAVLADAVDDVLRTNQAAWRAWLEAGSREDWVGAVGVLRTPALIIAGADDADLGPPAQQRLMARHFASHRHVTVAETGHLLPIEAPQHLARLIADFMAALADDGGLTPAYRGLIQSDRISTRTRDLLMAHAAPDDPAYRPATLTARQFAVLRAVLDRVVPQSSFKIDLAARIDAGLSQGASDGWRFAALPPDPDAYRAGLDRLDAAAVPDFTALSPADQDALLRRVAAGALHPAGAAALDARQMQLWFEDLRGDAVRLYVAHPATLARIGYSGIFYGGDGDPKPGFRQLDPGAREAWEPLPAVARA